MPDPTPAAYSLIPWVRRGLASLISAPGSSNSVSLPVTLRVNGDLLNAPAIRLIGPGQISGLDARTIVRTDPRSGATAFESNYLACVELDQPDLPWMFSPAGPAGGRLRPWICLVVLPDRDGATLESHSDGNSVLRIGAPLDPRNELPDLSTIDAWAHAQVTSSGLTGDALNAVLEADSPQNLARLIASRKLEPDQGYLACVVPTYRAGVHAGLGLPFDDQDLAPAWDSSTAGELVLPVYYSFRFRTGPGGDFASLARKIMPPKGKLTAGTRPMDASQPGFGVAGVPGVTLGLEGALRAVDSTPTPWPAGAQAVYQAQLKAAFSPPALPDPVVAPPTYGHAQSGAEIPPTGAPLPWLGDLNLDPRSRAAAGAGSQVVQRDQESLVASAWDQWGEVRKANRLLRQAQLARQVLLSFNARHLDRVAGDGNYLQITAPLHSRVRLNLNGATGTLHGHIQASRLPSGSVSPAMRRATRPNGPIGRQMTPGVLKVVDRLNLPASAAPTALQMAGPVRAPLGTVFLDDVSPTVQLKNMTATAVVSAVGWKVAAATTPTHTGIPVTHVDPPLAADPGTTHTVGPAHPTTLVPLVDWSANPNLPDVLKAGNVNLPPPLVFTDDQVVLKATQDNFRTASKAINAYLNMADATPPDLAPLGGQAPLTATRTALRARLNPEATLQARLAVRIPLGHGADPLQPVRAGPEFPQPMYAPLTQLSPDWMLPGISEVPADCAALLATNPPFIEAFLVGLNEELARELLWREFPADRATTYFRNFWGAPTPDIPEIAAFDPTLHLGGHVTEPSTGSRFVLLIRATLFERYPNAIVSAVRAEWNAGVRRLASEQKYPIFRGDIGDDVTFFGFDLDDPVGDPNPAANKPGWYFVIEEHVTEPRFGLEPKKNSSGSLWNDLSWEDLPPDTKFLNASSAPVQAREQVAWQQNAAAMAFILMRKPVRVALHARALLGPGAGGNG